MKHALKHIHVVVHRPVPTKGFVVAPEAVA